MYGYSDTNSRFNSPGQNEFDMLALEDGVENRQGSSSGVSEHLFDFMTAEHFVDDFTSCHADE